MRHPCGKARYPGERIVAKRKLFILQSCKVHLQRHYPKQYEAIVNEAYRLIPGFECRQRTHGNNLEARA